MACIKDAYWSQLRELERAMATMRHVGITWDNPTYQQLLRVRRGITGIPGDPVPRTWTQLLKLIGMSPGEIALWHDNEAGWVVEVRNYPGAPPVYTSVPDEVATDLLQGRHTHEYTARYARAATDIDQ